MLEENFPKILLPLTRRSIEFNCSQGLAQMVKASIQSLVDHSTPFFHSAKVPSVVTIYQTVVKKRVKENIFKNF